MNKFIIKYTIEKSRNGEHWVLWKWVEGHNSYSCMGIFKGTRRECYRKLKEIKGEL